VPAETWADFRRALGTKAGVRGDVACTNNAGGTRILKHNPKRVSFIIVNNEANAAHVVRAPGQVATTSGIRLDAAGGAITQNLQEDGTVVQEEVWAILETAAGNLYIDEVEEA
jgi:hypothetical protein